MRSSLGRVSAWTAASFFLFFGGWAFFAPLSFFEVVAPWPPYNVHLFHDAGAFSLGIGCGVGASLWRPRVAALAGAVGGAAFHATGHIFDHGDGGRVSDPYLLSALALLLAAGLLREWKASA